MQLLAGAPHGEFCCLPEWECWLGQHGSEPGIPGMLGIEAEALFLVKPSGIQAMGQASA